MEKLYTQISQLKGKKDFLKKVAVNLFQREEARYRKATISRARAAMQTAHYTS